MFTTYQHPASSLTTSLRVSHRSSARVDPPAGRLAGTAAHWRLRTSKNRCKITGNLPEKIKQSCIFFGEAHEAHGISDMILWFLYMFGVLVDLAGCLLLFQYSIRLLLQCSGDTYGLVRFKQKSFRRSNDKYVHH